MHTTSDARGTTGNDPPRDGRLRRLATIVIVDIAAPLVTYYALRAAGLSTVSALLISGVFPAAHVIISAIRQRRLDVVGTLVLAGIIVGTVLGLVSHSARLILIEGSVPTAVFGIACLGSLWTSRPLIYRLAMQFAGPDSASGREMTRLWQYEGYRRIFRTITVVWGVGFLVEAALRVIVVYNTSPGTALAISNVTPYVFIGVFCGWTIAYGTYHKRKGERAASAAVAMAADGGKMSGATADGSASIPE